MGNNKSADQARLVEAVKTPLGFFALVAVLISSSLTIASLTGGVHPGYGLAVIALALILVCVVSLKNPKAFYSPEQWKATASLTISLNGAPDLDLDVDKCRLVVRSATSKRTRKYRPNLRKSYGGWVATVDGDTVTSDDSVAFELVEVNGTKWKVSPFVPYENTQYVNPDPE